MKVNMQFRPLFGGPIRKPVAASKFITQVALPWIPILCSMEPQETALRSPALPSALGRNFGTMNSEMPLVPCGVGQAGQDDMDDVVGHVVLAGGDEDLGAGDLVAAVGLRLGLGAQHAQVGAAVRLGQHMVPVHSPETSLVR